MFSLTLSLLLFLVGGKNLEMRGLCKIQQRSSPSLHVVFSLASCSRFPLKKIKILLIQEQNLSKS